MSNQNMWSRPEDAVETSTPVAPAVVAIDAVATPVAAAPAVVAPEVAATVAPGPVVAPVVPAAPLTLLERIAAEAIHIEQEVAAALKG